MSHMLQLRIPKAHGLGGLILSTFLILTRSLVILLLFLVALSDALVAAHDQEANRLSIINRSYGECKEPGKRKAAMSTTIDKHAFRARRRDGINLHTTPTPN